MWSCGELCQFLSLNWQPFFSFEFFWDLLSLPPPQPPSSSPFPLSFFLFGQGGGWSLRLSKGIFLVLWIFIDFCCGKVGQGKKRGLKMASIKGRRRLLFSRLERGYCTFVFYMGWINIACLTSKGHLWVKIFIFMGSSSMSPPPNSQAS